MAFRGTGPTHPLIGLSLWGEPSAFNSTSVPQKAKDVRVEPVLLLIARTNVFSTVLPAVQLKHGSCDNSLALTNSRSFDVHELGGGKLSWACKTADKKTKENISDVPLILKNCIINCEIECVCVININFERPNVEVTPFTSKEKIVQILFCLWFVYKNNIY